MSISNNPKDHLKYIEGDYCKDGLLYCGKCHTPKEIRNTVFGMERIECVLCECEEKKYQEEQRQIEQYEFRRKVNFLRDQCFHNSSYKNLTFSLDDGSSPDLTKHALNYVKHFPEMMKQGKGILFFGRVGTGKTFITCCIANALIDQGYSCLVTNFATLTNTISGLFQGKQEYIDSLDAYDLLVIDDLASERNTEYMNEIVTNIIDNRLRIRKPLIITTNLTKEALLYTDDLSKQRVYSRLLEMCHPYEVKGSDRRKKHLKSDYSSIEKILSEDMG